VKAVTYILLCCGALILHSTVVKLFSIGTVRPDLILFALIYISLKEGSFVGVCAGFVIGLLQDIYMPSSLGVNAFANSLMCFLVGFLNEREWRTDIWVRGIVLTVAFLFHDIVVHLLRFGTADGLIRKLFLFTIPSIIYTLLIWIGIWLFLKRKGQQVP